MAWIMGLTQTLAVTDPGMSLDIYTVCDYRRRKENLEYEDQICFQVTFSPPQDIRISKTHKMLRLNMISG